LTAIHFHGGEGYFSYFWGILLLFTIPDEFQFC
jgi:hypothetical protein